MSSENPYQSPNPESRVDSAGSDSYQPPVAPSNWTVRHVRYVAILAIVQGALVTLVGGGLIAIAIIMPYGMQDVQGQAGAEELEQIVGVASIAYAVFGAVAALVGLLQIVAGARSYVFRNRVMMIVALFCGLLSVFTFYCGLTGLGLTVYGLIVFFSEEVRRAFQMRQDGASVQEILETFA
ncbi:MAG: hypothetical protein KDA60_17820 [Planctomycetales bacterium]|nr:hypothetical protein [Planctomycetales bacterium]